MAKYQQVFEEMLSQNSELFDTFRKIHNQYSQDPQTWRAKYNEEGEKVMMIIRRYETRLCGKSEGSGFGKFSGGLSEKFWNQVRKEFPLIDEVGLL